MKCRCFFKLRSLATLDCWESFSWKHCSFWSKSIASSSMALFTFCLKFLYSSSMLSTRLFVYCLYVSPNVFNFSYYPSRHALYFVPYSNSPALELLVFLSQIVFNNFSIGRNNEFKAITGVSSFFFQIRSSQCQCYGFWILLFNVCAVRFYLTPLSSLSLPNFFFQLVNL